MVSRSPCDATESGTASVFEPMQTASPPSSDANTSEFDSAGEGPRAIQVLRLEGSRTRSTVTRNLKNSRRKAVQ